LKWECVMNIPEEILGKVIETLTEVVDAKNFFIKFLKVADETDPKDIPYFFLLGDLIPVSVIKKGQEAIKDFKPANQEVLSLQTFFTNKIKDKQE